MRLHVPKMSIKVQVQLPLKPKGSDIQMAKYETEIEEI